MRQEGYEMMAPLNNLFHSEMTVELIKKAIPFIIWILTLILNDMNSWLKIMDFLEKR